MNDSIGNRPVVPKGLSCKPKAERQLAGMRPPPMATLALTQLDSLLSALAMVLERWRSAKPFSLLHDDATLEREQKLFFASAGDARGSTKRKTRRLKMASKRRWWWWPALRKRSRRGQQSPCKRNRSSNWCAHSCAHSTRHVLPRPPPPCLASRILS